MYRPWWKIVDCVYRWRRLTCKKRFFSFYVNASYTLTTSHRKHQPGSTGVKSLSSCINICFLNCDYSWKTKSSLSIVWHDIVQFNWRDFLTDSLWTFSTHFLLKLKGSAPNLHSFVPSSFQAMRGFNSMCQMRRILDRKKAELTDTILKPVYFLHFYFNSWSVLIPHLGSI